MDARARRREADDGSEEWDTIALAAPPRLAR